MDELRVTRITDNISYIEPTTDPLSANVVIIETDSTIWLYDVGNHLDIPQLLESLLIDKCSVSGTEDMTGHITGYITGHKKNIRIILSHFHKDHIGNLDAVIDQTGCESIYQGRYTYKHTGRGIIVEDDMYISENDMLLHIFPLPSSHARGCIALEVNEEYCFIGDGIYAMQKGEEQLYNAGLLKAQIDVLSNVKAGRFMCSHRYPFGSSKTAVIKWLESIYGKRDKDSAYIVNK